MPADAPEGWTWDDEPFWEVDQRPEIFPSGPDMRGGELELADGGAYWAIKYDDRGVWKETTMSSAVHPPDFTNHHAWRVTRQRWQVTE